GLGVVGGGCGRRVLHMRATFGSPGGPLLRGPLFALPDGGHEPIAVRTITPPAEVQAACRRDHGLRERWQAMVEAKTAHAGVLAVEAADTRSAPASRRVARR